jgi:hypothetical protein
MADRAMRAGLIVSLLGHLVLVGWGVITMRNFEPLDASHIETLPVEFIEIADVTSIDKGLKSADPGEQPSPNDPSTEAVADTPPAPEPTPAPEEEPAPPPPPPPAADQAAEAEAAEEPAPEPPAAEPEPLPEPASEPAPAAEPAPPQETAAATAPTPRLRPDRPAPPSPAAPETPETSEQFADTITALLNKTETGAPQAVSEAPATLGVQTGSVDARMTESEISILKAQVEACWIIPTGWTHPREVSVTIRFALNRDGTVNGAPTVVEFPASQYGQVSADNAIRAVLRCGPYNLPEEKYDLWSEVQLRFTPPG